MCKIKTYAYIKFELESPLAVGSGYSKETDKDVLKNSKGEPYIPATALAGVYRSFFDNEKKDDKGNTEVDRYFGYIAGAYEKNRGTKESDVIVYDAVICDDSKFETGIRNGVGLDEYRTAKEGAKFDFEIVHPGTYFWTAIEYTADTDNTYPVDKILSAWKKGIVSVGSKATRGLGRLKCIDIKYISFVLPEKKTDWLNFDIYDMSCITQMSTWDESKMIVLDDDKTTIHLTINQMKCSPLTVRVYSTEVSTSENTAPDYSQLTYERTVLESDQKNARETVVVIPGTSWAGTFRHNMIHTLGKGYEGMEEEIKKLFGRISKVKGESARSEILFSETYFNNAKSKIVSRNAINRFSGGASDSALFTEKMYYGGKNGKLTITIPENLNNKYRKALAIAIADMQEGFLTVGGESSIGHGMFEIINIEIDGKESFSEEKITGESIYRYIYNSLMEGKQNE